MTDRLHRAWYDMRARCTNPNHPAYRNYGARHIVICERWQTWENFRDDILATLGEHPGKGWSIDRIRNNGNYEPGNLRYADAKTQARNSRARRYTYR